MNGTNNVKENGNNTTKRISSGVAIVAQVVVILAVLVSGIIWLLNLSNRVAVLEKRVDKLNTSVTELGTKAGQIFAEWERVGVNEALPAETDGLLMAWSGGGSPNVARFALQTGESEDSLKSRSRAGQYEGALIPVRKGEYYLIKSSKGDPMSITAYWLPILSEDD